MPGGRAHDRWDSVIPLLTVLSDAFFIFCSFLLSYWLRFNSGIFERLGIAPIEIPPVGGYLLGSAVMVLVWLFLFRARKMYRARRSVNLADELIGVARVSTLGMLIVMSAAFFYRDFSYSRIVFGLLWLTSVPLVFLGRLAVAKLERTLHRGGRALRTAVLIGNEGPAEEVFSRLQRHPSYGFDIHGYFAEAPAAEGSLLARIPRLGTIQEAGAFLRRDPTDVVFLGTRVADHPAVFELIGECEGLDIEFMMVPDVLEILTSKTRLVEFEGVPFLTIKSNPLTFWGRFAKRAMDIGLSAGLLLILSPLMLLIALAVRLTSRGPVFYRQERVGLDGTSFQMLKFRSMRVTAEEQTGPVWAERGDPRRTALGVLLRKSSMDELPQLINVLRGDMSLVGPRPERPFFVGRFKDMVPKYLDRHRVKTGITGWAQVNGLRGDTSLEQRIRYDLYYIENWSLTFDVKILLMTVRAALRFREVH